MFLFKRFRPIIFQVFILSLMLLGLHGETAADTNPFPSVTIQTAGWLELDEMYELNGLVRRPENVSVSEIEMSFAAIALSDGQRWQLPSEVSWEPDEECAPALPILCSNWHVSLDVSALPTGDYNLKVRIEFDPDGSAIDIFGDTPDERCSLNCPDDGMPTCNGGLCQHVGIGSDARLMPSTPELLS